MSVSLAPYVAPHFLILADNLTGQALGTKTGIIQTVQRLSDLAPGADISFSVRCCNKANSAGGFTPHILKSFQSKDRAGDGRAAEALFRGATNVQRGTQDCSAARGKLSSILPPRDATPGSLPSPSDPTDHHDTVIPDASTRYPRSRAHQRA